MKNRYYLILPLGLSLFSCVKEQGFERVDSNVMSGIEVCNGRTLTKCTEGLTEDQVLIQDMPVVTSGGDTLYLSATLRDMEDVVVEETKGVPISSSNITAQSPDFYTFVFSDNTGGRYSSKGTEMYKTKISYYNDSSAWDFESHTKYFWPSDNTNLTFVSLAPARLVADSYIYKYGASGYDWNSSAKTFKLRYQSRKDDVVTDNDASNLADLLYAYNVQNKDTDKGKVKVSFRHACVGVRLEIGDIYGTIESISLNNFYRNGDFTIKDSTITWSGQGSPTEFKQVYNIEATPSLAGKDLDTTNTHAKTFMIVPQTIGSNHQMIIKIGNTLHPETLSFDNIYSSSNNTNLQRDWSKYTGKILTFRLSSKKANNVSVTISDEVVGLTKKNIVVKNDGRSDIFIRMKLVGNWLNEDDQVLASWDESNPFGTFTSKNGFPSLNNSNWKKGSDGFYYYRKYLKSGKQVSENLFDTFTVTSKPVDASGTWAQGGTKMEIKSMELALLLQAVVAEANLASFKAAWGDEMTTWIGTPVSDE